MFVALSSYEVSLIVSALQARMDTLSQQAIRALPSVAEQLREKVQQMRTLELRLTNEQAKHELKEPDAPIMPGSLQLKHSIEGTVLVDNPPCTDNPQVKALFDAAAKRELPPELHGTQHDPSPPPTEPNLGAEYHLLKFIDAMREKHKFSEALTALTTSEVIEAMGQALAVSKGQFRERSVCQLFAIDMACIVNHLEEG